VFDVPVTFAVNCSVLPSSTLEPGDVTTTATDGGGVVFDDPPPPHPGMPTANTATRNTPTAERASKPCLILNMAHSLSISIWKWAMIND
jgi:hypothetical protein